MPETILLGRGKRIVRGSGELWRERLEGAEGRLSPRLSFMTPEHHRVRDAAVVGLPRSGGEPLAPQELAAQVGLPPSRVEEILEDLERNLFFLVRNEEGQVSWAFTTTVEATPHRLVFSTGERVFGACAEDAVATPFVHGALRNENLEVEIQTECAYSKERLTIRVDSECRWEVGEEGAEPLVFEPEIDWAGFRKARIIDDY